MSDLQPSPGAKMIYLIKRRPRVAREELVAHWFANHMPAVIAGQKEQAARGKLHATRYIATLFDAMPDGVHPWDGMAQLWWPKPLPSPEEPHGSAPTDTFQQKAEPYMPWATTEYVVIDGEDRLDTAPLTLNDPYPTTRSGFFKVTFLVKAKTDADYDRFFSHWLNVHADNVANTLRRCGGFRYTISHSQAPAEAAFAGMAELYFDDANGWRQYRDNIQDDGMQTWASTEGTLVLRSHVEMVGIP